MHLSALQNLLNDLLKLKDKKLAATVAAVIVAVVTSLVPGVHLTTVEVTAGLGVVVGVVSFLEQLGVLKAKAKAKAARAKRAAQPKS